MKRDMDLIRNILIAIENEETYNSQIDLKLEESDPDKINYHVLLLHEAGLIQAAQVPTFRVNTWKPLRLTWDGHEFLEAAKDKTTWNRAKEVLLSKTGGLTFDLLKALLLDYARRQIFTG